MLAAGGVALERALAARRWVYRALVGAIVTIGLALAALALPVFAIETVDATAERLFGWVVPPMALTHDMHGEHGWDVHVDTVEHVLGSLSSEDRSRASILTRSYAQAAALNVLRERPSPRAVSGHMSFYLWGPEEGRGAVLIAYGLPRALLERHYRSVEERARIVAPLARPGDTDLPVYVCRDPSSGTSALFPELRRFDHGLPRDP